MDFKYKSFKQCNTCMWLRRRPLIKVAQVNEMKRFNPQGLLSAADFQKKYAVPVGYISFINHLNKHITKVEKRVVKTIINDKEPIRKVMADIVEVHPGQHEDTLDTFISQFDDAIRNKQIKMTAKDGLQAIKIKADMIKGDKDRKKDILKIMVGASEQRRPSERAEA